MKKTFLLLSLLFLFSGLMAKKYKGAEIRTNESFLYGKFEVKMKSCEASGMLVSFFTFYDNPDFAKNWNEIDIEILGRYKNEVQFNAIVPGSGGSRESHEHRHVLNFNPHDDFHIYAFEWTPDYIAWLVDGKEVYRQTDKHIKKMNRPQKIMMNIWPPQLWDWTGPWKESKLPLRVYYDYVKYYEYTPAKNDKFTLSWEDNFDKLDASRWSFATHTFDDNACDFDPGNVEFKDGYLILSLTMEGAPVQDAKDELIKSSGRITVSKAEFTKSNTIRLTFSDPVYRKNLSKENFVIEGLDVLKLKFIPGDLLNVDVIVSPADPSKTYNLNFTASGQGEKPDTQVLTVKGK